MMIMYTDHGETRSEKLTIRRDGEKYIWFFGDDTIHYSTNNDGEGIFIINERENSCHQLVGTCDWRTCVTDKATRSKIKRWLTEFLSD